MLAQKIWPITGPTVNGGTTYLFLRSDITAWVKQRDQRHGGHQLTTTVKAADILLTTGKQSLDN
jgi:hypothetical protein